MSFKKMLLLTPAASLAPVAGLPGAGAADLPARKQRRGNVSAARLSSVSGNAKGEKPMKLRNKKKALAAMSLVAFVTSQATARADDIAAEIRLLKARVKQLEPLKQQLK